MTAIWWIRRDFRLSDNAALTAAAARGAVIPVFIRDPLVDALGAAPKWRMEQGLAHLRARIETMGGRVILRSGPPCETLFALASETGAQEVHWSRAYDATAIARDTMVKAALTDKGVSARSHSGHLLVEPWAVQTRQGGFYKVYTPFWRAVRGMDMGRGLPVPKLRWPAQWPQSEALTTWQMGTAMQRGAEVVAGHALIGEETAEARLVTFVEDRLATYATHRDLPARPACSGLSEPLTYGEISPRRMWTLARQAWEDGAQGGEVFLKEMIWREFAAHLFYHCPDMAQRPFRAGWESFPWRSDPDLPEFRAWQRGRTGVPFVDAAMRELYVTGRMHNRMRMIVASYLTKHLLIDWRLGRAWFEDCLTDWDAASNAMGWQWVAGCGPDAAPYFRIFNPEAQAAKFDSDGVYKRRWLAEGQSAPPETARAFFDAVPRAWQLSPHHPASEPLISLKDGRARALAAYEAQRGRV